MIHVFMETFLWLLGLCVGSFLNVVVYRLAVGLSIADPIRSFCPNCKAGIAWYDNIPVLSWLLLRARCRHCAQPISIQYPLVEALTGLTFVLVYHLLFVVGARAGLGPARIPYDLPVLLNWLILAAGLIACSAMDLVSYTLDVRVTNLAMAAGVFLHALWPQRPYFGPAADTPLAAGAVLALVAVGIIWLIGGLRSAHPEPEPAAEEITTVDHATESFVTRAAGGIGTAAFVLLAVWFVLIPIGPAALREIGMGIPIGLAFVFVFLVTAVLGGQPRAADSEIHAVIEEESPLARRRTWQEIRLLAGPVAGAVLGVLLVLKVPAVAAAWHAAVTWTPGGSLFPVAGAAFAIKGAMIAAAAGWFLRILFTLIYGREAFGVGDIYLLAAAGATAGWDIALLGLLLSVGIALAGWAIGLALKSTAMIPLGPWLAIGFMAALWYSERAHATAESYAHSFAFLWQDRPATLAVAGGLLLVGSAVAIVLARLLRRWVAPDPP